MPRERALAKILKQLRPNWRELAIHESSPIGRGVSEMLRRECRNYTATQYMPGRPLGEQAGRWRNENLEAQTVASETFDIVVSLDVMEHVFNLASAFREIYRTLKPGGLKICTFPIYNDQVDALDQRAKLVDDRVVHLAEPEYHGNPVSAKGALVAYRYGPAVADSIATWAPFNVSIFSDFDRRSGVLGEMRDVIVCEKSRKVSTQIIRGSLIQHGALVKDDLLAARTQWKNTGG